MDIIESLAECGIVFLENQSRSSVKELLQVLGQTMLVTDVKINTNNRSLVTSDRALGFHTDHSKVKYIAWYCIKQCDVGGETLVMDTKAVLDEFTENELNTLCNIHLFEHKIFDDDPESTPLLKRVGSASQIYYSFWLADDESKQNEVFRKFRKLTESSPFKAYKLKPNDILIIDNQRMLHGRTAIGGNKDRHLKRFWIN